MAVIARIGPPPGGRRTAGAGGSCHPGRRPPREPEPGTADAPGTPVFTVGTGEGTLRPAELDGRCPSAQVATGFTGRVIGMYVTAGRATFDWFDYVPADATA